MQLTSLAMPTQLLPSHSVKQPRDVSNTHVTSSTEVRDRFYPDQLSKIPQKSQCHKNLHTFVAGQAGDRKCLSQTVSKIAYLVE